MSQAREATIVWQYSSSSSSGWNNYGSLDNRIIETAFRKTSVPDCTFTLSNPRISVLITFDTTCRWLALQMTDSDVRNVRRIEAHTVNVQTSPIQPISLQELCKTGQGIVPTTVVQKFQSAAANNNDDHHHNCSICLESMASSNMSDLFHTQCNHTYHSECIEGWLQNSGRCPLCKAVIISRPGPQCDGIMFIRVEDSSLPGYAKDYTFVLNFVLSGGVQDNRHSNPGVAFSGDEREAYLPTSPRGHQILEMMVKAFYQRWMFGIGRSLSSHMDNVITYSIHLKTSRSGGTQTHGYPCASYLEECAQEIARVACI